MENKQNTASVALLLGKGLLVLINSAIIIYTIKISHQIYLPTFTAGFTGLLIGFIDPKKGWIWALIQVILMIAMYFSVGSSEAKGAKFEMEMFTLIGSVFLVFIVSLGTAFIKRAD